MDALSLEPTQPPVGRFAPLLNNRRSADTLSGPCKAAVFCVALGEEVASEIFRFLDEEEVQQISRELTNLHRVSSETAEEVVEEFHQLLMAQSYVASGGVDYAKRLLVKTYGPEVAKRLLDRITRSL